MDKIIEELSKLEELLRNSKADLPDNILLKKIQKNNYITLNSLREVAYDI